MSARLDRAFLRICGVTAALGAAVHLSFWNPVVAMKTTAQVTPEEQTKYLVVMIRGKFGEAQTVGAGIIVGRGPDRLYVATANHVVRQGSGTSATQLEVLFRWLPGEWQPATLLDNFDQALDLAVIAVPKAAALLQQVQLSEARLASDPKRGQQVFPIGYGAGEGWASRVTPDLVAGVTSDAISFETSLELQPGQSGGALVNRSSEIVGLVKHYATPVGVAIPMTRVLEWMRQWNYPLFLKPAVATPPPTSPPGGRTADPGTGTTPPTTRGGPPLSGADPARTVASEWPMAGGNEYRSGLNAAEKSLRLPVDLVSRFHVPGLTIDSLTMANGRLYVAGMNQNVGRNQVVALDASGARVWVFTLDSAGGLFTVPAFIDGVVVVGARRDPNLYAIASDTGRLLWKSSGIGDTGGRDLLARGQTVYALTSEALVAVEARNGKILWRTPLRPGPASPVFYGTLILVTERTEAGYTVAAVMEGGAVRRSIKVPFPVVADPVTAPVEQQAGQRPVTTMFISSGMDLAALTLASESPVWGAPLPGTGRGSGPRLGVAYGVVVARLARMGQDAATAESGVLAFDAATGKSLWAFVTRGRGMHGPAIANGLVFVTSSEPAKIFAISVRGGNELWYSFLPTTPTADPIVANGQLYVPLGDTIFVYGPARGR